MPRNNKIYRRQNFCEKNVEDDIPFFFQKILKIYEIVLLIFSRNQNHFFNFSFFLSFFIFSNNFSMFFCPYRFHNIAPFFSLYKQFLTSLVRMPIVISKDNGFLDLLRSNLKKHHMDHKRKPEDVIHVSDILFGNCLRKAYYQRVVKDYEFTDEDIDNFVRGEASEHVLVDLADIGVGQHELYFENDLVVARPDLLSDTLIVEFKDTKTFERLTPDHYKFKGYLRQLLYYLVISGKEHGVLNIRYASNRKLQWLTRDDQGDYYFAPPLYGPETTDPIPENKLPELETWAVFLGKDDFVRELLKNEIKDRAVKLRGALDDYARLSKVIDVDPSREIVRLPKVAEKWKCVRCPFLKICDPDNIQNVDSLKDGIMDNFVELKSTIVTCDRQLEGPQEEFIYKRGESQN